MRKWGRKLATIGLIGATVLGFAGCNNDKAEETTATTTVATLTDEQKDFLSKLGFSSIANLNAIDTSMQVNADGTNVVQDDQPTVESYVDEETGDTITVTTNNDGTVTATSTSSSGEVKSIDANTAKTNIETKRNTPSYTSNKTNSNTTSTASSSNTTSSNNSTSNSSSSSSSNKTNSSSNKTNSSSTTTQPTQHVHNWVAQTTTKWHPQTGHNEQTWVQDTPAYDEAVYESHAVCNGCGIYLDDMSDDEMTLHLADCLGSYRVKDIQVGTIHHEATGHYVTNWVIDSAGYDETITTGYKCSSCGATK